MKNSKKRILLFIKVPPPVTGATLMNNNVYDSKLLKTNFDMRSIRISYAKNVSDLGSYNMHKLIVFIKVYLKLLYELIFQRPSIIYFQLSHQNISFYRDAIFVILIKIFKIKIVFHLQGKGIRESSKNKFKSNLFKYVFMGSDIICLSHLLTYDIETVFNGNIHVVPNASPDLAGSFFLNKKHDNENIVRLLYLSNLLEDKGIVDFVKSLYYLCKKSLNFKAFIVGSESDITVDHLNDLISDYDLKEYVVYLGPKYNQEKYKCFVENDIFIFPTKLKHEAFPVVLTEAMQFGMPIISTKNAAIPEIIDEGVNGFLVEKNSPKQISEKLELLINNSELRKAMGNAGRKKYEEKYTLQKFEENMLKVFNTVIANKN